MNKAIFPILLLLFASLAYSFVDAEQIHHPIHKDSKINWLSWEEAIELSKKEKKKIFVDVYTDWCGWCKRMDATTFQEKHIAEYINENYHPVKFNAEQKESITINGKEYKYIKDNKRGYHELAAEILRGKLSYPTIVFLNEDMKLIQPIPGFQKSENLEVIMTYFAQDHHKKTPWSAYQKAYVPMKKTQD